MPARAPRRIRGGDVMMVNHPNRAVVQYARHSDGQWTPAGQAGFVDDVRKSMDTPAAFAMMVSAHLGVATRRPGAGTTHAVIDFGGDAMHNWINGGPAVYAGGLKDEVVEAFFDRRGALRRDVLERAAALILAGA